MRILDDNTETTTTETPASEAAQAAPVEGSTLLTTPQTAETPSEGDPAPKDDKSGEGGEADGDASQGEGDKSGEGEGEAPSLFGAPAEDAEYQIALPEGVELDSAMLDAVTPIFREMDLSDAGAQKFIDAYIEQVQPALAQQIVAQIETDAVQQLTDMRNTAEAAMKSDASLPADQQVFGGATQQDITRMAAKAMDKFGSPDFRAFLETSGLGNNLDMIRLLHNVGKSIAEDTSFPRGASETGKLSREEKFYGAQS